MRNTAPGLAVAILTASLLSGCASVTDPFKAPGTWHESTSGGAVLYDLRAEVANPHDLFWGQGSPEPDPYGGMIAANAQAQIDKPAAAAKPGGASGGGASGGSGGGAGGQSSGAGGM